MGIANYNPAAISPGKKYTVDVKIDNKPIKKSPFKLTAKLKADASQCIAKGGGLISPEELTIILNDNEGDNDEDLKKGEIVILAKDSNLRPVSKCKPEVTIDGPDGAVKVKMKPSNTDGTFIVTYNPDNLKNGEYTVNVLVDKEPIQGSPIKFISNPSIDPSQCYAAGGGLNISPSPSNLSAALGDQPDEFTIYALNSQGKPVRNKKCEVKMSGPKDSVEVKVEDNNNGTFVARYDADGLEPGEYTVDVLIEGQPIKDSPLKFRMNAPEEKTKADPKKSYAKYVINADQQPLADYALAVFALDSDEQPVVGADCTVEMKGPDGPVNVRVEDSGDGTFKVKYRPELLTPGNYSMNICVDGQPLENIPEYHVKSPSELDKCVAASTTPTSTSTTPITTTTTTTTTTTSATSPTDTNEDDGIPDFTGFEGSPPQTAEDCAQLPLALRSVLHSNDFVKVSRPCNGKSSTLFFPRLTTS